MFIGKHDAVQLYDMSLGAGVLYALVKENLAPSW